MKTPHVMLDLETMGTGSWAAIVAIGAVKFDPERDDFLTPFGEGETVQTFYLPVSLESSMKAGLRVDAKTIEFWIKQTREASSAWLTPEAVGLEEALIGFSSWYGDEDIPIWGNGATFDNVVLSNAYQVSGIDRPWTYKMDRCLRTFRETLHPLVERPPVEGMVKHHALDDAVQQAVWLQKIVNLRSISMSPYIPVEEPPPKGWQPGDPAKWEPAK